MKKVSRPKRDPKGFYLFDDFPLFKPNRSPKEVLQLGSFGGTYFRPIKSAVCPEKKFGDEVWKELPEDWIEGLDVATRISSSVYRPSVNKYKVKSGASLEEWEQSGWIKPQDPYGWFQWYCRFFQGRRTDDDARQVARWLACAGTTGRWRNRLCKLVFLSGKSYDDPSVSPVIRQTLLHWGYELPEEHYLDWGRKQGAEPASDEEETSKKKYCITKVIFENCTKIQLRNRDTSIRAHSCTAPLPLATLIPTLHQQAIPTAPRSFPESQRQRTAAIQTTCSNYHQAIQTLDPTQHADSLSEAWNNLSKAAVPFPPPRVQASQSETVLNNLRTGNATKAAKAINSCPIIDATPEALDHLYPRREPRPSSNAFVGTDSKPISRSDVNSFLRSRDNKNSHGLNGPSISNLIKAVDEAPENGNAIAQILTDVFHGKLPPNPPAESLKLRGLMLEKAPGNPIGRPIGIGETPIRILEGVISKRNFENAKKASHHDNYTLQKSGPTNLAIIAQLDFNNGRVIMSLDESNAFNNTSAFDAANACAEAGLHEISALINFTAVRDVVFTNSDGTEIKITTSNLTQGSSPSTIAMSIIEDKTLKDSRTLHPGARISNLADDMNITSTELSECLQIKEEINNKLQPLGRKLNAAKSCCTKLNPSPIEIQALADHNFKQNGLTIAGVPIGTPQFIQEETNAKVQCILDDLNKLTTITQHERPSVETENCTIQTLTHVLTDNFVPRAIYIAQTVDPEYSIPPLTALQDRLNAEYLKAICVDPDTLTPEKRAEIYTQLQLRRADGSGHGLLNISKLAHFFRFGALVHALPVALKANPLQETAIPDLDVICEWLSHHPNLTQEHKREVQNIALANKRQIPFEDSMHRLAHELREHIHRCENDAWKETLDLSNPLTRERHNSIQAPETSRFLSADPRYNPITDPRFVILVKRHLGLPITNATDAQCSNCQKFIDPQLEHPMHCPKVGKNSIHQPIVKAAYRSIRKLASPAEIISSTYEPSIERYLRPDATAAENPRADIIVRHHITSNDVLLDFTFPVIKPSNPNNMSTVKKAENDKTSYYQKNFDLPNNLKFVPCAIDTYGKWGDELKSWVKKFCSDITTNTAEYSRIVSKLRDDIAIAHANATAKQIQHFLVHQRVRSH